MEIASLFAVLGLKPDRSSWNQGQQMIDGMKSSLVSLAATAGVGIGMGSLIKSGLTFNSTVEDTRNQIAGMLALTKRTDLADQMSVADGLLASLQKRAAALPGTTREYAQMLGMLAQPVSAAGLGLQDLEDITVNAVVAAKALGVEWEVGARDIAQALQGQFHATDMLTGKILATMGYVGEEGRKKFNALSATARGAALKAALTQKQLSQLAEQQGKSASGKWSTFADTAQQTLGRVMAPVFRLLVGALETVNAWLDRNADSIKEVADVVGDVLKVAFEAVGEVVGWVGGLIEENREEVEEALIAIGIVLMAFATKAAAAWVLAMGPFGLIVAGLTALIVWLKRVAGGWSELADLVRGGVMESWERLKKLGGDIRDVFVAAAGAIRDAFENVWGWFAEKIEWVEKKLDELSEWAQGFVTGYTKETQDTIKAIQNISPNGEAFNVYDLIKARDSVTAATVTAPTVRELATTRTVNINGITITVNETADGLKTLEVLKQRLGAAFREADEDN